MGKTKRILAKVFYPIIIIATDIEVRIRLLPAHPLCRREMGYCVDFWVVKKSILKDRYNIDWETPLDKHPGTHFD